MANSATNAAIVGTTTAGAFGTIFGISEFKRCIFTYYPELYYSKFQHRKELEGRWVEPLVVVRFKAQDLMAGRDTVLEASVKVLNKLLRANL